MRSAFYTCQPTRSHARRRPLDDLLGKQCVGLLPSLPASPPRSPQRSPASPGAAVVDAGTAVRLQGGRWLAAASCGTTPCSISGRSRSQRLAHEDGLRGGTKRCRGRHGDSPRGTELERGLLVGESRSTSPERRLGAPSRPESRFWGVAACIAGASRRSRSRSRSRSRPRSRFALEVLRLVRPRRMRSPRAATAATQHPAPTCAPKATR